MSKITAQQLYNYAKSHNLCSQVVESWTLKHFGLIVDALSPDEHILTAFCGLHNYKSISQHDGCFAYVITEKRFMLAQKRMIGSVFQTISISNVNDVTLQKGVISSVVTVDTIKETFNVDASRPDTAQNIYNEIHKALDAIKQVSNRPAAPSQSMTTQLVELKKLLDAGIITQRDFDMKKQQILGI